MILSRGKALCREIRSCNGRIKKTWNHLQKAGQKARHTKIHTEKCVSRRSIAGLIRSKILKKRRKGMKMDGYLLGKNS